MDEFYESSENPDESVGLLFKDFLFPTEVEIFLQRLSVYGVRWNYALEEKLIFRWLLDILLVPLHCWLA